MATPPTHSDPDWPKISIITPSFQQANFIEETIRSVLDQDYPSLEFIVIDGGSTDETVNILRAYDDRIDFWVSEKDRGQSHAINKGVAHATGDIIQWINSDDILLPGALKSVAEAFRSDSSAQLISGKTIKFGEGKQDQIVPRGKTFSSQEDFLLNFWFMQPSCFFRADIFKALTPVNEQLKYSMDTDLFMRYFLKYGKEHVVYLDTPLVRFRMHDDSKTFSRQLGFISEQVQIDQNVLDSCSRKTGLDLGSLIEEPVDLAPYVISDQVDADGLRKAFHNKWSSWTDPSKRFREVADNAGLHGDKKTMRQFAWKAILANPTKALNYRYWLHTFRA